MPARPKYNLPFIDFGNETIGQRIARIRNNKKISQQKLAEKIGITRELVSGYERGKVRIFGDMVARFAIALEVSADEILGLKNNPPIKKK
jgi:transcriptional regulator with XRE-family HTH domain